MKGLYLRFPDGHHTWGLEAHNDSRVYDKLSVWWSIRRNEPEYKNLGAFRQGDSEFMTIHNKEWLYIEFLGAYAEADVLEIAEKIAKELHEELKTY